MISITTLRLYLLYAVLITIVLSLLNLNSIFLVALVCTWILDGNFSNKWSRLKKDKLFVTYSLYFIIQIAGIALADNLMAGWKEFESKAGLFGVPLIFCSTHFLDDRMRRNAMMVFSITLSLGAIFCLIVAMYKYVFTADATLFFYHQLVVPLNQHAVYFGVFILISLIFLTTEAKNLEWLKSNRSLYYVWILFYLFFVFLLSSKMVLLLTILYLLYLLHRSGKTSRGKLLRSIIAASAILFLVVAIAVTENPVKKRFVDLRGNIEFLTLRQYNDAMYFNGWQFRMLLWRFTYEIIRDNKSWVTGVGPANDQIALQKKYVDMGLYAGLESRGDQGYLEFNCHNQFLQSFLESGIPGLLVFLSWCVIFIIRALRKNLVLLSWMTIILFAFFFIESVFERQYGIILVTVFPLMYLYSSKSDRTQPQ